MIEQRQKGLVHLYKNRAKLSEPTYRGILRSKAGVNSCADPSFSQSGFDAVMAAIETILFHRVDAGEISNPIGTVRQIRDPYYWRNRLPKSRGINSRQLHRIEQLWAQLKEWLPDHHCSRDYLLGIAHKSTNRRIDGLNQLQKHEAAHLIDALTDRLAYAIRTETTTAELPF